MMARPDAIREPVAHPVGQQVALMALALILPGCTVGPDYHPVSAEALKVPGHFASAPQPSQSQADIAVWWTGFKDPVLSSLIAAAMSANIDIDAARGRLRAARSALRGAQSATQPVIGLVAETSKAAAVKGTVNESTSYRLGVDASWETDLFGGNRRAVEAARAGSDAVQADLHAVQVSIAAELALNYVAVRLAQANLDHARANLGFQDETVQIAGWRAQAGLVSSLDLEQSRVLRAQTAASIPVLETDLAAASNRIAVLIAEAPGAVLDRLTAAQPIPLAPDAIATGLPADLLQRRPDIAASERRLAEETARIGVATAQLYPALRLTGSLTTSSLTFGGMGGTVLGGIASGITAPIFAGGQIHARIESQRGVTDTALANYRQTVLTALEDVENALVALRNAQAREEVLAGAEGSAQLSLDYARIRYRSGLADFQTLLESERSLLSTQDGRLAARAARASAQVQLYKALGGGWAPDPTLATVRP